MDIVREICTDSFYTVNSGTARVPLTAVYSYACKATIYSVKTVSTDFSGNIHRKCTIFFPELHLPNGMTTSPHTDHSSGPKPIQLIQVVFTIE